MPIEIKEIIVRTTVTENRNRETIDVLALQKIKAEIYNQLKSELLKTEKRKRKR